MSDIPTWHERAMRHPDHQTGMVSEDMIRARMGEEISDLRAEVERLTRERNKLRAERRERIATAALQGLISNPQTRGYDHEIAARAVRYADALIVELNERENGR